MDGKSKQVSPIYEKGQRVGQYEVIEALEQTRLKQTYLAQEVYRQTRVLLEVFQPPLLDALKEDFLLQVSDLKKLKHPYIQPLRDANVQGYYPFFVTDYHRSYRTLRQVYPQGSKQPLASISRQLEQLASALSYVHGQRVVHGDIRPENILVDKNNNVLLWGFALKAIAQNRERLNYQPGGVSGESIGYASPEEVQGKALLASDQYSLAVLIYELLSGALPFSGTALEIAHQQMHAAPPSLSKQVSGISPAVEEAVMRSLAKDPVHRFPSVQDFMHALMGREKVQRQAEAVRPAPIQPTGVIDPPQPAHQDVPMSAETLTDVDSSVPPPSPRPAFQQPPVPAFQQPHPLPATPAYQAPSPPIAPTFHAPTPPTPAPVFQPPATPNFQPRVLPREVQPPQQQPYAANNPGAFQPPTPLPAPPAAPPPLAPEPLAPRKGERKVTRRVFAVGLVGIAALGGAGAWYEFSQRLVKPAPPIVGSNTPAPATTVIVNNKQALIFAGHLASINAVAWSPDGRQIASASDDTFVQIFDARTGSRSLLYSGHNEEVAAIAWSPDGAALASAGQDKTVQIWRVPSGQKLLTFKGHTDRVNAVSWSKDSLLVASGSDDKSVQVWNARSGDVRFTFLGHTAGVLSVDWQPDNTSVASGSWDGTLRDWATVQHGQHFRAGEQIFNYGGHGKNEVNALAWSPNSALVASAGADQTVQLSSGINGTPRLPFYKDQQHNDHVNPILSLAWSPDGNSIASGDNDGTVHVWRVADRKTFFIYTGHKGPVNALAWSPDGTRIASASADGTVHVWQPA